MNFLNFERSLFRIFPKIKVYCNSYFCLKGSVENTQISIPDSLGVKFGESKEFVKVILGTKKCCKKIAPEKI